MATPTKPKGPWLTRFFIRFFTLLLGILVFWVLGFLVEDIRSIPGPDYSAVEAGYLDKTLLDTEDALQSRVEDLNRQIENLTESQRVVGDSSRNLQQTMDQLIELQRLGLEKNVPQAESGQADFSNTLSMFLESQRKYQELGQSLSDLITRKQELSKELTATSVSIERQREPARKAYNQQQNAHRLRLAFYQLAILVPILVLAGLVVIKKKGSIYFPLFLAFGVAALLKVTLVVHEYFPTRYFKYILIGGLLLVVAKMLIHFLRTIAFPKAQSLLKQYREAYERFLCPACDYPIRIGPRRFLFWTRSTVNKLVVPGGSGEKEEAYTCPACGTALFEECPACHNMRHAMLPHCTHCGVEKEVR